MTRLRVTAPARWYYGVGMPRDTDTRWRQWLLLCVLSLAVIGMHHLAFASARCEPCGPHTASHGTMVVTSLAETAMDSVAPAHSYVDPPTPGPDTGHDLLHLCLAVLAAAAGLLLVGLLLAFGTPPAALAPRWYLRTTGVRRRRTGGRSILTSVCVLRI